MVDLALKTPSVDDISYPYVHPLMVLNLAREFNVQIVIPSVLYFLTLYSLEDLLRGDHPKLLIEHPSKPSAKLCMSDIKDYTLMFQHRLEVLLDFVRRVCAGRTAGPSCLNGRNPCTRGFAKLASLCSRSWMIRTGPFRFMTQAICSVKDDVVICSTCQSGFQGDVNALRYELWMKLPHVVGLPSWEDLEAMDLPTSGSEPQHWHHGLGSSEF